MYRIPLIALGALLLAAAGPSAAEEAPPPVGPGDTVLGDAKAPVTVIEYFSLDCPHCASWEATVFPKVKSELIDPGKIRFVLRDFPLHAVSLQAAQLARCEPDEYLAFVDTLLASQRAWVPMRQGDDPVPELAKIARLGGISQARFDACEKDQKLAQSIVAGRAAGEAAGVTGTPHFFFNGKGKSGEISYEDFAKQVQDAGS